MNDLSLTRDEQEIEFLRLQVLEQQHVIDDLSLVSLHEHERQPSVGRHETQALGMASGLQGDAAGGVGSHRAPPGDGHLAALFLQKAASTLFIRHHWYLGAVFMATLFLKSYP